MFKKVFSPFTGAADALHIDAIWLEESCEYDTMPTLLPEVLAANAKWTCTIYVPGSSEKLVIVWYAVPEAILLT